jgi:hypothetical protein
MLRIGHFLFKYRNLLFPLLFVPLAAIIAPGFLRGDSPVNAALDVIGVLVVIAGLALRALVVGLAYIKRGGKGKKVHADSWSPRIFAHARNPLPRTSDPPGLALILALLAAPGRLSFPRLLLPVHHRGGGLPCAWDSARPRRLPASSPSSRPSGASATRSDRWTDWK